MLSANGYARDGNFEAALNYYEQATTLDPEYKAAYRGRSRLYSSHELYELALEDFLRGHRLGNDHDDLELGWLYRKTSKYMWASIAYSGVVHRSSDQRLRAIGYEGLGFVFHARTAEGEPLYYDMLEAFCNAWELNGYEAGGESWPKIALDFAADGDCPYVKDFRQQAIRQQRTRLEGN